MIVTVLAVLHILVCVFLILLIMIQDPKGGSNSLFGAGGSNTLLGTSGGADFMTKVTRYTAIIFVGLCVALTIATRPSGSGVFSKSPLPEAAAPATNPVEPVVEGAPATAPAAAPTAAPAAKPAPSVDPKAETK
ncbi:MAG: preprotein translocase subunit SecG [Bdellovibrionaceae bacterium]|nr:preprotein translocase subunit SecG [Pseudobdellovibrionaceae bacterium]